MGRKELGFWRNSMAKGLLLAAFDFSGAHADEYHDWYDLEHIPEAASSPGIRGVRALDWHGAGDDFRGDL